MSIKACFYRDLRDVGTAAPSGPYFFSRLVNVGSAQKPLSHLAWNVVLYESLSEFLECDSSKADYPDFGNRRKPVRASLPFKSFRPNLRLIWPAT